MMTDVIIARIHAHRSNIQRYVRLLVTELTETERRYIHKRIAEERSELERLEARRMVSSRPPRRSLKRVFPKAHITPTRGHHHHIAGARGRALPVVAVSRGERCATETKVASKTGRLAEGWRVRSGRSCA
jgi:hypothetical protein